MMHVVPLEIGSVTIKVTASNVQGRTKYNVEKDREPYGPEDQDGTPAEATVNQIAEGFIADITRVKKRA